MVHCRTNPAGQTSEARLDTKSVIVESLPTYFALCHTRHLPLLSLSHPMLTGTAAPSLHPVSVPGLPVLCPHPPAQPCVPCPAAGAVERYNAPCNTSRLLRSGVLLACRRAVKGSWHGRGLCCASPASTDCRWALVRGQPVRLEAALSVWDILIYTA